MIASISNFDTSVLSKSVSKFTRIDAENQLEKIRKRDGVEISSKGVIATDISIRDVYNAPLLAQIEKDFQSDFYSRDFVDDITLYDISSWSDEFPFELEVDQVLSYKVTPKLQVFDIRVKNKGSIKPHRIQMQVENADESIMNPAVFEKTVLKGLLKYSDAVKDKLSEIVPNSSWNLATGIIYDSSTRTVDWEEFGKELKISMKQIYEYQDYKNIDRDMQEDRDKSILNMKAKKIAKYEVI